MIAEYVPKECSQLSSELKRNEALNQAKSMLSLTWGLTPLLNREFNRKDQIMPWAECYLPQVNNPLLFSYSPSVSL